MTVCFFAAIQNTQTQNYTSYSYSTRNKQNDPLISLKIENICRTFRAVNSQWKNKKGVTWHWFPHNRQNRWNIKWIYTVLQEQVFGTKRLANSSVGLHGLKCSCECLIQGYLANKSQALCEMYLCPGLIRKTNINFLVLSKKLIQTPTFESSQLKRELKELWCWLCFQKVDLLANFSTKWRLLIS